MTLSAWNEVGLRILDAVFSGFCGAVGGYLGTKHAMPKVMKILRLEQKGGRR